MLTIECKMELTIEPMSESTIEPTIERTIESTIELTIESKTEPTIAPTIEPMIESAWVPHDRAFEQVHERAHECAHERAYESSEHSGGEEEEQEEKSEVQYSLTKISDCAYACKNARTHEHSKNMICQAFNSPEAIRHSWILPESQSLPESIMSHFTMASHAIRALLTEQLQCLMRKSSALHALLF